MIDSEATWVVKALRHWVRGEPDPLPCPAELSPERLGDQLERNRLLPAFYLIPIAFPETPDWEPLRARIAAAYQRSLLLALQQLRAGAELMRRLEEAGIRSLAVRGPFLALDVYGDPAARVGADVDILVPRERRRNAWRICRDMGYRSVEWEAPLWPLDAHRIHWRIRRPEDHTICELHWTVEPLYGVMSLPYSELFARSCPASADGFDWREPCSDHRMLLLCLHAGRHLADLRQAGPVSIESGEDALDYRMLFRWLDVALFLRKYASRIDWNRLYGRTMDRRACLSMAASLRGARDWLGVNLPEEAERLLPLWTDAASAQRSSGMRRRVESWWTRKAAPAVGMSETAIEDVLYFIFPHALFFAPSHGAGLLARRVAHGVVAAARLLGSFLLWVGFVSVTAMRRAVREKPRYLPGGGTVCAGGRQ